MKFYPIAVSAPNYVTDKQTGSEHPILQGTKLVLCPLDCPALPNRVQYAHPLCANYLILDYNEFDARVTPEIRSRCPGLVVEEVKHDPPLTDILLYDMGSDYIVMGWDEGDRFNRHIGGGDCPLDCPARISDGNSAHCTIHPRTFDEFVTEAQGKSVDTEHCPTIYLHNK